jgi:hypothetical protein
MFSMTTNDPQFKTKRLVQLTGDAGKKNDVVFCGTDRPAESNVIFFTGDVQDYKEKMLAHRDNTRFASWDVESTAVILCRRFPRSHIWVIKASRMELGTFSIFSNFVQWKSVTEGSGGPMHSVGQGSWHHLQQLMVSATDEMNRCHDENVACVDAEHCIAKPSQDCARQTDACSRVFSAYLPIILVGFSKGCVVLNQLVYDLSVTLRRNEMTSSLPLRDVHAKEFAELLTAVYWLDGGHNGGREIWITNEDILRSLVRFEVNCHVTPYQIDDPARPWNGREQRRFIRGIEKLGGKVTNVIHFENEERSLENHFRVLELF